MTEKVFMHSLEDINKQLEDVSLKLSRKVTVFHIGGNAMCWYGLKETTKDSDLVLLSEDDANLLVEALLFSNFIENESSEPGYEDVWKRLSYPREGNVKEEQQPTMKVELFVNRICGKLFFSDGMISRSQDYKTFGKLDMKMCSKEDIFLFKAASTRRDRDDLINLVETGLDWKIISKELDYQFSIIERSKSSWIKDQLLESIGVLINEDRSPPSSLIEHIENI